LVVFSLKPRTLMSSIMRARSGLTGRFEDWEVIGGSSLKPKVAGPSMLGIGCPNCHAFLFTRSPTPPENPPTSTPPSRESGFVRYPTADHSRPRNRAPALGPDLDFCASARCHNRRSQRRGRRNAHSREAEKRISVVSQAPIRPL